MTGTPRRPSGAGTAVFVAAVIVGLGLAWLTDGRRPDAPRDARGLERTGEAPRGLTLEALSLRDVAGTAVDLSRAGVPQVVMINSTTCGVCKKALADFRDAQPRGALARLVVVTLEGADSGAALLALARVTPGAVLGPANEGARATMTFQFPGTPVFFALDSSARVVATLPGYPGREAMAPWVEVMQGRRAAP